ncbi:ribonucleotide reductase subunit alpha [Denitromonas iodatirespirans]|uniref:Ribonucleotide reductase subunit alpha n=1 Tax=Denitromonas iodatirespirans TaxID=2795389 RepID=A0A944DLT7_DENI1|nr:ribonucleotide reductase subunit alpha [Denitromonas iodatirespirans]MBT0961039.1 ribonucleotide reductase subunit alpha [Denitromonas iodatirespirans]
MELTHFNDFLTVAAQQTEPQHLLFVFATAALPAEHTDEEARRFAEGQGGTLTPVMYVDKAQPEVADFDSLVAESKHTGRDWQIVFVAALDGHRGQPLGSEAAQPALELMVKHIENGQIERFLAFDKTGRPVRFV